MSARFKRLYEWAFKRVLIALWVMAFASVVNCAYYIWYENSLISNKRPTIEGRYIPNDKIRELVEDFEYAFDVKVDYSVVLYDGIKTRDGFVTGVCVTYDGGRFVAIDPKVLNRAILKWVVFHELAHCSLNLDHSDDKHDIMWPDTDAYHDGGPEKWNELLTRLSVRSKIKRTSDRLFY